MECVRNIFEKSIEILKNSHRGISGCEIRMNIFEMSIEM
jgi:hypothetical protein